MTQVSIAHLTSVMPPPKNPIDAGDSSLWAGIEEQLGTALPDDYKLYINTYGVGCIANFIWIINPFTDNKHLNFNVLWLVLKGERFAREEDPLGASPYPVFPEPGGILPWGVTDNGDQLFWKTGGAPSEWNVIVNETRSPYYNGYFFGLTIFLSKILTRHLEVETFPHQVFRPDMPFRPQK